jgi:hypothetical protein
MLSFISWTQDKPPGAIDGLKQQIERVAQRGQHRQPRVSSISDQLRVVNRLRLAPSRAQWIATNEILDDDRAGRSRPLPSAIAPAT